MRAGYTQTSSIREGNPHKTNAEIGLYWANARRLTAVQRIYAGFSEREEEQVAKAIRIYSVLLRKTKFGQS